MTSLSEEETTENNYMTFKNTTGYLQNIASVKCSIPNVKNIDVPAGARYFGHGQCRFRYRNKK